MAHEHLAIQTDMSPIEWGDLLDGIKNQKCIVCIGTDVFRKPNEPPFEQQLASFLESQAKALNIRVHNNGWYHLLPMGNQSSPYRQVKEFYQHPNPHAEAILRKLVQIPFHLFLSITPDNKLKNAFEGYNANFEAYSRNCPFVEMEVPTAEKPLVFNLLGKLEDRNSLVLTHDDFFDYLESVFRGNSMSPILKEAILKAEYFLFLGMPFDQWYMHLFMRILRQHKEKLQTQKFAVPMNKEVAESCQEQYTIRFVNSDIDYFITELLKQCEKERLIRKKKPERQAPVIDRDKTEKFFNRLLELLEQNEFEDIYDAVKKELQGVGENGRKMLQNFIQLKGRYNDLKEQMILGLIRNEDQNVEMNQLRKGFYEQIDALQMDWTKIHERS